MFEVFMFILLLTIFIISLSVNIKITLNKFKNNDILKEDEIKECEKRMASLIKMSTELEDLNLSLYKTTKILRVINRDKE